MRRTRRRRRCPEAREREGVERRAGHGGQGRGVLEGETARFRLQLSGRNQHARAVGAEERTAVYGVPRREAAVGAGGLHDARHVEPRHDGPSHET